MSYESKALHVYITKSVIDDNFLEKWDSFFEMNVLSSWSCHYWIYETLQSTSKVISPAFFGVRWYLQPLMDCFWVFDLLKLKRSTFFNFPHLPMKFDNACRAWYLYLKSYRLYLLKNFSMLSKCINESFDKVRTKSEMVTRDDMKRLAENVKMVYDIGFT